jgi:peptide/nickel transport system substrate-binding protein
MFIKVMRKEFVFLNKILWIAVILCCFSCKDPIKNKKKVFTYNESTGIATLDPAFAKNQSIMWAVHQLYNTLVEIDSNLNIVPSIAKSWEISEDRKVYIFHLRDSIFFHDHPIFKNGKGRKLVADDVVFSLNRIQDKQVASSGAWIFNNRIEVNGFKSLNDSTFELKLLRPFQPILGILSMQYCSIVPREIVNHYGKDFRNNPCGTGPFKFISWDEGEAMILHKNEHYWEKDDHQTKLPYIDAIKVSFFDNKATEFLQFRQNKLSFINDIDPSFKDEILAKNGTLRKEWANKLQLKKHPYLNTEYMGILVDESNPQVQSSPTKSKAVRQAMNYAINRPQLMMYMRNSIGIPAVAGFVPSGLPSRNTEFVKGYHYDPDKSRLLLKESGYIPSKQPVKLLTVAIYADIASFIARQLEEVGINVQVEVVQKSLLLEQTAKSQALFFRASWIADYPDAENYMTMFYSKNPAPPNYTRYKNPDFDILYEKALQETNDSIRYDLYRKMDQIVIDDAPILPLWYDMAIHLVQNNISGFSPNALNLLELRKCTIN